MKRHKSILLVMLLLCGVFTPRAEAFSVGAEAVCGVGLWLIVPSALWALRIKDMNSKKNVPVPPKKVSQVSCPPPVTDRLEVLGLGAGFLGFMYLMVKSIKSLKV